MKYTKNSIYSRINIEDLSHIKHCEDMKLTLAPVLLSRHLCLISSINKIQIKFYELSEEGMEQTFGQKDIEMNRMRSFGSQRRKEGCCKRKGQYGQR